MISVAVEAARHERLAGGSCLQVEDEVNTAGICWILVPGWEERQKRPRQPISIGAGPSIGESCTISAVSHAHIGSNVLFGPRV